MYANIAPIEKYFVKPVNIQSTQADIDLDAAKAFSTAKVREIYPDAMLLAWIDGVSGDFRPKVGCDFGDKPAWLVYALSRGADLTILVDGGRYVFVYNTNPTSTT